MNLSRFLNTCCFLVTVTIFVTRAHCLTNEQWVAIINEQSKVCNIPPSIIEAHIRTESQYCKYTKNKHSTARGCLQVVKATAGDQYHLLADDVESIRIGVAVLCKFKSSFPNTYSLRYYIGNGKLEGQTLKDATSYFRKLQPVNNKYFTCTKEYDRVKRVLASITPIK